MKQTVSRERFAEIAAKYGIGMAPRDSPIYSGATSVIFTTYHSRPTEEAAPDSDQTDRETPDL